MSHAEIAPGAGLQRHLPFRAGPDCSVPSAHLVMSGHSELWISCSDRDGKFEYYLASLRWELLGDIILYFLEYIQLCSP